MGRGRGEKEQEEQERRRRRGGRPPHGEKEHERKMERTSKGEEGVARMKGETGARASERDDLMYT